MKNKQSPLLEYENHWPTRMGGAIIGQERVVIRGKDLFTDLSHYSWHQLLLFMITGREFDDKQAQFLDRLWAMCISYPDPRIWNNRIAALAATNRSTASLGVGAGVAVSEAKIYGGQATLAAIQFIRKTYSQLQQNNSLDDLLKEELKQQRRIAGYGRPVTDRDERVEHVKQVIKEFEYELSDHAKLAFEIEQKLEQGRLRYKMNIAGLVGAIAIDMGFSDKEYYYWLINGYNAGLIASYVDAREKPQGALFPLRCEKINYLGFKDREWN
jgi:hypothetical protein